MRLQNEDIKSEAELLAAGGAKSQLPNDDKIYLTALGLNKTLKEAIEDGTLGGYRAGAASLNIGDTSVEIVFSTPLPDAAYAISVAFETSDGAPVFQPITVKGRTAAGCFAHWNAPIDAAGYALSWIAQPFR